MRKIQLSVLLIALCLLFATYAASAKEAIAGKQGRRYLCIKNRPGFSKLPKTLSDAEDPWYTIYNPNPLPSYLLSEAEAEKINWKKIGKKLAGIGNAAGHIGAIKGLFFSDAEAEAEFRPWFPAGRWGTPPRSLSDAEHPWRTIYNQNPRPHMLSEAEAEKINWKKVAKKLAGIGNAAGHLGAIKGLFLSEAEAEAEFRGAGRWGTPPYVPRSLSDAEGPMGTQGRLGDVITGGRNCFGPWPPKQATNK